MDLQLSDAACIRSLSRIFQTAAKLSEFLQFTPTSSALNLRILNASQTTFASFRLHSAFFSQHNFPLSPPPYKVPTRALLPLLRSPASIASLRIRSSSDSLHFIIHARSGVCKQFRLPIVDGRVSTVSALDPRYSLRCSPRLFLDILVNFHVKLDEITLVPTTDALKLTSFVDDDPSHVILRTEMTVSSSELEQYHFPSNEQTLTIPCRSLRTTLDFCDPFDSPITIAFTHPGDPLLLTFDSRNLDNHLLFDARFVFATRQEQSANRLQSRRAATQLPAVHESTPAVVPPSDSDRITTSIRQPIATHSLRTPPLQVRHTHTQQSPSSAYVSASQSQPNQDQYREPEHPSSHMPRPDQAPASFGNDLFVNYPALSDSLPHQEDDDDEYVDATPPP